MTEQLKKRPDNCRNALQARGEPYPRSGCAVCGNGGLAGCPYEQHSTTLPAGMALVPREITAETGHKAGMMSEFSQSIPIDCGTCDGDGLDPCDPDEVTVCPDCDGDGEYQRNVNISWTTIKAIHRRIVELSEVEAT